MPLVAVSRRHFAAALWLGKIGGICAAYVPHGAGDLGKKIFSKKKSFFKGSSAICEVSGRSIFFRSPRNSRGFAVISLWFAKELPV